MRTRLTSFVRTALSTFCAVPVAVAVIFAGLAGLVGAAPAHAQLVAPNAAGFAIAHVHVNAVDVDAQSRFWTQLGGKVIQREKLTMVQFPGMYVIIRQQKPTGGSVGTVLNHIGFWVKDFKGSVAKWQAAGLP